MSRLALTVGALTAALITAPAAEAQEVHPTSQAIRANATFLATAPPPPAPGAVCLVDSGVDLNPDTSANVIARIAYLNTPGLATDDVDPNKHGTLMASVAGAPGNGWGMTGIWPHLQIVSVRAANVGTRSFPFTRYAPAISRCHEMAVSAVPVRAVNLSLGGAALPSGDEFRVVAAAIEAAGRDGLSVVAAAGNTPGAVQQPAAMDGVIAVGAGPEAVTGLCPFAAGGGGGLDIIAPGCRLDQAMPDGQRSIGEGSSQAAVIVSTILTALRSYAPHLTAEQAEGLLVATARGGHVDAAAAFRAAGLAGLVDAAPPTPAGGSSSTTTIIPADPTEPPSWKPIGSGCPPEGRRLPAPAGSAKLRGRRLALKLTCVPTGVRVRVEFRARRPRSEFATRRVALRTLKLRSGGRTITVPKRWSFARISYVRKGSKAAVSTFRSAAARKAKGVKLVIDDA
ncbi:MAG: S8/S53 family peptidase [Solirubrobacteraceae bacterium]|nr:S8/S53 family peptidase [Solirubrobacteraceae bacterium]